MKRLEGKAKPKARGRKTTAELLAEVRIAGQAKRKRREVASQPRAEGCGVAEPKRNDRDRMAMQRVAETRRDQSRKFQAELDPVKRRPKR